MRGVGSLAVVSDAEAGPGRDVTVVLATADEGVLGALPPFVVATPYWQDVAAVVKTVSRLYRIEVVVLRLLRAEADTPPDGGRVTYLAETGSIPRISLDSWCGGDPLAPEPSRAPYAELGGPAADLRRAAALLADVGREPTGRPEQIRTWNLSSLWRLPTAGGPVWLKSVPPMFAHEGPLIEFLRGLGAPVPQVLGRWTTARGSGVLLAEVDGDDHYGAGAAVVTAIARRLVDVQIAVADHLGELAALGVPDGRDEVVAAAAQALLRRIASELSREERVAADRLVADLPRRLADVAACGLPVTLVHGDAHPGNARGPGHEPILLDWGDSRIGQPAVDLAHLVSQLPAAEAARVLCSVAEVWGRAVPGSDARRAAVLAAPVDALAGAIAWQGFLDRIEPDERPYHEGDPAAGVRAALRRLTGR